MSPLHLWVAGLVPALRQVSLAAFDGGEEFWTHFLLIFKPLLQPFLKSLCVCHGKPGDGGFNLGQRAHLRRLPEYVAVLKQRTPGGFCLCTGAGTRQIKTLEARGAGYTIAPQRTSRLPKPSEP